VTAATVGDGGGDVCNEGEVEGAGEQENELHQRWPGIGLAARRSWRDERRPDERGRGVCAALATALAADRGAAGQGDAVR